ncbi:hypothetical protein AB3R30_20820 [Leptolyngbyaceae cyanobacterium UHCC 1019]
MKRRIVSFLAIAVVSFIIGTAWKVYPSLTAAASIFSSPSVAQAQPTSAPTSSSAVDLVNQAQQLAKQGNFSAAIATVDKIQPANPEEAKTLLQVKQRWADEVFKQALNKYEQGDVNGAIDLAERIPANTPAQQQYAQVRKTWFKNSTVLELAEQFHQERRCTTALSTISLIQDPALLGSQRVQDLKQAINSMQAANPQAES